ncbi:MAG: hypothetical protein ACR2NH_01055, partial [Solirubrobacteraceae bacterium]
PPVGEVKSTPSAAEPAVVEVDHTDDDVPASQTQEPTVVEVDPADDDVEPTDVSEPIPAAEPTIVESDADDEVEPDPLPAEPIDEVEPAPSPDEPIDEVEPAPLPDEPTDEVAPASLPDGPIDEVEPAPPPGGDKGPKEAPGARDLEGIPEHSRTYRAEQTDTELAETDETAGQAVEEAQGRDDKDTADYFRALRRAAVAEAAGRSEFGVQDDRRGGRFPRRKPFPPAFQQLDLARRELLERHGSSRD